MRSKVFLTFLLVAVCSAFCSAAAQFDSSGGPRTFDPLEDQHSGATKTSSWISGAVLDANGRPVQNATVEIHGNIARPESTCTAADGSFRLYNIPAGEWELVATKIGISEARQQIVVESGLNLVTLIVPAKEESVEPTQATITAAQLAVPGRARLELQKAEKAFRRGKFSDANRLIEKALTVWPRFAEAITLRALLERGQHSSELAMTDAQRAIEVDPNYPKAYAILGAVFTDINRSDDAIRTLDHAIAIAPNYWPSYYEMSRAFLLKGDFTTTLRQAEKASALVRGEYPPLHLVKGYAYLGLKNEHAAQTELETYIKLEPNTALADRAKQALAQLSSAPAGARNSPETPFVDSQRSSMGAADIH